MLVFISMPVVSFMSELTEFAVVCVVFFVVFKVFARVADSLRGLILPSFRTRKNYKGTGYFVVMY